MSVITYPVATSPRVFTPRSFTAALQTTQRVHASPFGGSEQAVDLLNDRWLFSLELAPRTHDEAAQIEAFIGAMRGATNTTELHHFARPAPRGTISGTVTAQDAAQGASSIVLNATTGHTFKAGDLFGVSGLLLQVAADCTAASGAITVPLVNRLRSAIVAGAAVTLSQPKASFRLMSAPRVQYVGGYAEGTALDFAEVIA
jgi:hypothetical protein